MERGRGALSRVPKVRALYGGLGVSSPRKVSNLEAPKRFLSTCHEICLRKIDLDYENGKQLQVTTIKITESKESKSIHRLDLSGSTGPGGQLPLATALRIPTSGHYLGRNDPTDNSNPN